MVANRCTVALELYLFNYASKQAALKLPFAFQEALQIPIENVKNLVRQVIAVLPRHFSKRHHENFQNRHAAPAQRIKKHAKIDQFTLKSHLEKLNTPPAQWVKDPAEIDLLDIFAICFYIFTLG